MADSAVTPPLTEDGSDWSSELAAIHDDGLVVTRLAGAFPPAAMDEDLWFRPTGLLQQDLAMYERCIEFENVEPPEARADAGGDVGGERGHRGGRPRYAAAGFATSRRGPAKPPWPLALLAVVCLRSLRRRCRRQT